MRLLLSESTKPLQSRLFDRLQSPELRRFFKFALVGGSGVVVNMAFRLARRELLLRSPARKQRHRLGRLRRPSRVSIATNFLLNDAWTWGDRRSGGHHRLPQAHGQILHGRLRRWRRPMGRPPRTGPRRRSLSAGQRSQASGWESSSITSPTTGGPSAPTPLTKSRFFLAESFILGRSRFRLVCE